MEKIYVVSVRIYEEDDVGASFRLRDHEDRVFNTVSKANDCFDMVVHHFRLGANEDDVTRELLEQTEDLCYLVSMDSRSGKIRFIKIKKSENVVD